MIFDDGNGDSRYMGRVDIIYIQITLAHLDGELVGECKSCGKASTCLVGGRRCARSYYSCNEKKCTFNTVIIKSLVSISFGHLNKENIRGDGVDDLNLHYLEMK